jgi:hypothetical protein
MTEYFDDARKEAWRLKHPGIPDPQVWCRDATQKESPPSAWRTLLRAQRNEWKVRITYARGCYLDNQGHTQMHVIRVPRHNEGGEPELTPKGKQAYKEEKTDDLYIVESVVLRAWTGEEKWLRATWERVVVPHAQWKFSGAWTNRQSLSSVEMNRLLDSQK